MQTKPPDGADDTTRRCIRDETGTQRLVGYVVEIDPDSGHALCWLDVEDRHLNRSDRLHGGIAAMLLDSAAGRAAGLAFDPDDGRPTLTLSMTVDFLAAGRPGRVTATARVTGGGRRTKFVAAELHHEDGTLIATATGVFQPAPQAPQPQPEGQP